MRWRVFGILAVADLAIGLGYLAMGPLDGSYSFPERVQDVVYELVGVYGPCSGHPTHAATCTTC